MSALAVRARARVTGTVQGVGFRPFVYRLAHEETLGGWVLNDEHGVLLEVEGDPGAVDRFLGRLTAEAPPLAAIDAVAADRLPPTGERTFAIRGSASAGTPDALVAADAATCPECLAELHDPGDRRFRYPFTNCTNCGPRFTIVRDVPYDRPLTTMAGFSMCEACRGEYEDPGDRRFHAQPNACPACGPRVSLIGADGSAVALENAADAVAALAARLAAGAIAAVKGLGGYHLVCDAARTMAVAALRSRKHREDKPFALMVADVDAARALVELDAAAIELLESPARPIVLALRRPDAAVAHAVAPGAPELGVMLPYTPLHHLLLGDFAACGGRGALVMTSGNVSDEPIAYRDDDAVERLSCIADVFLVHDREIETRTDDSVARTVSLGGRARPLMLRRSRGYVPARLTLPVPAPAPLLACGAEQKSTFCVARGERAWVGHHIGDLEHVTTLRAYTEGIAHFERLFAVAPAVVVHDLHPAYLSTQYALDRHGVRLIGVQHHHAHLAAALAEHGLGAHARAVGAIFDGTGYGTDATVWGGELLVGGLTGSERAGRLWPVRMPGAAAAIRQPWRMAWAWLAAAFGELRPLPTALAAAGVTEARWAAMAQVGTRAAVSPETSSIGRLFDAVGALCGLRAEVSYEGQAAVELEAAARRVGGAGAGHVCDADGMSGAAGAGRVCDTDGMSGAGYAIELVAGSDGLILDPRPAVRALADDLARGIEVPAVAARFHAGLAAATVAALARVAGARGLDTVVLSGGVFQNRLLLETVATGARAAGLRVLVPEQLPPNDGGISYGQAAIAAARLAADS
ncbi:MAG: carbamoyltransferase HypF [Solirubrobacterales bacterium]|nr:carbamoyltransferase HypF [Solirubrobacterales bacterium]